MTEQIEALRLANSLSVYLPKPQDMIDAAAELRRLSEIETLYLAAMRGRHAMSEELLALTAQRDALLEALKLMLEQFTKTPSTLKDSEARIKAHAAIAQTEGQ